ncbi:hypothetical protein HK102_008648 [Quaeritorhiza haematococci]|nr:hypothetical protein HK102_008648 [Quaeritorhiza haematococci]
MGLCRPVDYTFISVFVFIVLYLINPYLIFALRRVSDNYGIKRELVIAITSFITLYTVHLLGVFGVIPLLPYGLTYNWVVPVSTTLCHTVLVVWPTIASFHHTANPVSSNGHQLAYNQESFEKALKDPELYGRFKEVVAQDFCTENVAYHEFYLQLADMPVVPEQAVELLKTRFLNPGAPQELNLSSAVKKKLLHRLDDPTQVKDVLKTIHDDVAVLLYTNSFPKFIKRERILVSTHAHV